MANDKTSLNLYRWLISALLISSVLGCQGQNPFKRQSDPLKDYKSVTENANQPYVPGQKDPDFKSADASRNVCVIGMLVSVEGDRGQNLMMFSEEKESRYRITVRSMLGNDFTISDTRPQGSTFSLISQTGNKAVYEFAWTPRKGKSKQLATDILKLSYSSGFSRTNCDGDLVERINLVVAKTDLVPSLQFLDLPQNSFSFGEGFDFKIRVSDPAATQDTPPELSSTFQFLDSVRNGSRYILDASQAVECQFNKGKFIEGTTWEYSCRFESSAVKDVDTHIDSGREVDAVFFAQAKSTNGEELSSILTPAYVTMIFDAAEPAPEVTQDTVSQESNSKDLSEGKSFNRTGLPIAKPKLNGEGG